MYECNAGQWQSSRRRSAAPQMLWTRRAADICICAQTAIYMYIYKYISMMGCENTKGRCRPRSPIAIIAFIAIAIVRRTSKPLLCARIFSTHQSLEYTKTHTQYCRAHRYANKHIIAGCTVAHKRSRQIYIYIYVVYKIDRYPKRSMAKKPK